MTNFFKAVIIDRTAPFGAIKKLNDLSILTVLSTKVDKIITDLSTHPDMQIFQIQPNTFVCEPTVYDYYVRNLSLYGVKVLKGATSLTSKYPEDIAYNAVRIGDFIIHRADKTDDVIKREFLDRIVNVRQGYTKCSICKVSENAVITSDEGIAAVLKNNGVDVLLISHGGIKLSGFDYGFIGGCSGLIASDVLAFCGDITRHCDYGRISAFLYKHNVSALSLSDGELTDVGSIIGIGSD